MSDDARPIKDLLGPASTPSWESVAGALRRRRHRRRAAWVLVPALLLLALPLSRLANRRASRESAATLTLLDGAPLATGAISWRAVRLSDRSRVQMSPEASMRTVVNRPDRVEFELQSGTVRFEVTPGGPRRWRIDCGLATVFVVGTGFEIRRDPAEVRVTVQHGTVRVEGPGVAGGVALLSAGRTLSVRAPEDLPARPVATAATAVRPPVEPTRPAVRAPSARPSTLRSPVDAGPSRADASSDDAVVRDATDEPELLWARANEARSTRSYARAAPILASLIDRFPHSPRAPMAAMLLGRDQLRALSAPRDAAVAFARALALGLPPAIAEEAWLGLVEARWRAGDRIGASEASVQYRTQFPHGVHRAYVEQLVRGAP